MQFMLFCFWHSFSSSFSLFQQDWVPYALILLFLNILDWTKGIYTNRQIFGTWAHLTNSTDSYYYCFQTYSLSFSGRQNPLYLLLLILRHIFFLYYSLVIKIIKVEAWLNKAYSCVCTCVSVSTKVVGNWNQEEKYLETYICELCQTHSQLYREMFMLDLISSCS